MKKLIKKMLGLGAGEAPSGERPPEFYDEMYATSEEYRKPFWQSRYYFLWTVILDRLRQGKAGSLLEIGCGSGQFAELLSRDLPLKYTGIDISREAIEQARRKNLSGFQFDVGDALVSPYLDGSYDSVVCTEVLEHIEQDRELVQRIKTGTRCLCTVPNFPYKSHVRHFTSDQQVLDRYGEFFQSLTVWGIAGSHREGTVYYLFDGIRGN